MDKLKIKRSDKLEITSEHVIQNLKYIVGSFKDSNPSVVVRALELLGKYLKIFTEKQEQVFSGGFIMMPTIQKNGKDFEINVG